MAKDADLMVWKFQYFLSTFKQCCGSGSVSGSTGTKCFWPLDPDLDPLVRGMDPDPSTIKNSKINLGSYCFVTFF